MDQGDVICAAFVVVVFSCLIAAAVMPLSWWMALPAIGLTMACAAFCVATTYREKRR